MHCVFVGNATQPKHPCVCLFPGTPIQQSDDKCVNICWDCHLSHYDLYEIVNEPHLSRGTVTENGKNGMIGGNWRFNAVNNTRMPHQLLHTLVMHKERFVRDMPILYITAICANIRKIVTEGQRTRKMLHIPQHGAPVVMKIARDCEPRL